MKHIAIKFSIFLFLISTALAGALIDYFHVRNDGDDAIIEWKTSQETNILKILLFREEGRSLNVQRYSYFRSAS